MLKKGFLSLFDVLWNPGFSWVYHSLFLLPFTYLLSSAICKASSDNHFPLYLFFFETVLVTASCTMLQTSIHSSSGNLLYLIPWMYPLPPLYYNKGFFFFRSYLNGPVVFPTFFPPYFLQFKPKFYNKELIIWVTGNSRSYFYWLYSASPALAAKNIIIIIIIIIFCHGHLLMSMCRVISICWKRVFAMTSIKVHNQMAS